VPLEVAVLGFCLALLSQQPTLHIRIVISDILGLFVKKLELKIHNPSREVKRKKKKEEVR